MADLRYLSASVIPSDSASSHQVMRMSGAFVNAGLQVTLVGVANHHPAATAFRYYSEPARFQLERIRRRGPKYIRTMMYALDAAVGVKRSRPNVLYGRHLPAVLASSRFAHRTVLECHALPSTTVERQMIRRLVRQPSFSGMVAISEALAQALREITRGKAPIIVAHDGALDIASHLGIHDFGGNGSRSVGYIGSLYAGKGVEVVVGVARLLPDVEFHVVGGRTEDVAEWRSKNPPSNIVWHGHKAPMDAAKLGAACSVLLAPYQHRVTVRGGRGDISKWMSPLKVFEYMALKRPMIASSLPVLNEVLRDGDNCLMAPPDDYEAWAHLILTLLDHPDMRTRIAERAYDEFVRTYTWDARAQHICQSLRLMD